MRQPKFWLLLTIAVSLGLLIAWLHAGPVRADMGLMAMLSVALPLALGWAMPRYAWLWALASGIWLPVLNIALHGNAAALLVLPLAFAGAYAGLAGRHAWTVLAHEDHGHAP